MNKFDLKIFIISNRKKQLLLYSTGKDFSKILEYSLKVSSINLKIPELYEINEDMGLLVSRFPEGEKLDLLIERNENIAGIKDKIETIKDIASKKNMLLDLSDSNFLISGSDIYLLDFTEQADK
ncbi:MAG: hypothetical protein GXX85_11975 [Ignavibacteria bacterium]|nr:hypothetical protein [Ignavibacteria bacterium]